MDKSVRFATETRTQLLRMSYFFRVVDYNGYIQMVALPKQKRKGRNLGRQSLLAQYRLPKIRVGDMIEVQELKVHYDGNGGHYEPRGFIRRVARLKQPTP